MQNRPLWSGILPILATLAIVPHLQAADLTYTFEKLSATTNWNVATAPVLPQFDQSTLGTLTSVSLLLDFTFSGSGTFTNLDVTPQDYVVDTYGRIGLTRVFVSGQGFGSPGPWVQSGSDPTLVGSKIFTNLQPNTPTPYSYTYTNSATAFITGADLASFIGTGSLTTYLKAITTFEIDGGSETQITTNPQAYGKITLTYDFVPVPEPTTYATAGVSALTMGWIMRRRKRARLTQVS